MTKGACDRFGDCMVVIVDEAKFWVEVLTDYMGWDEESQERWANDQIRRMGAGDESLDATMTLDQAVNKRIHKKRT